MSVSYVIAKQSGVPVNDDIQMSQTPVKKLPVTVAPNGILQPVAVAAPAAVVPDLTIKPIVNNTSGLIDNPYTDIPVPVRTGNMPDSVWNNIVNSYNSRVTARKELTDSQNSAIMEAARVAQVSKDQQAAVGQALIAATNIKAHVKEVEDATIAEQGKLDPVTQAMQTVFITMDAADKAKQELINAGGNATPEIIKAATVTAIAQAVAVNNAADVGAILPPTIQRESASNAEKLIEHAAVTGNALPPVIPMPDLSANSLPLASNNVVTAENVVAVITKLKEEGLKTDTQAAGINEPVNVIAPPVKKLGLFDRLIEFIYQKLYA